MQTRYLPSAHSDVNNNDRYFQARSIDRGDLYRTCTPNVIRNDRPAFHWHSVRELPTDRGSFNTDTSHCVLSSVFAQTPYTDQRSQRNCDTHCNSLIISESSIQYTSCPFQGLFCSSRTLLVHLHNPHPRWSWAQPRSLPHDPSVQ